ncbi:MAG: MmgE/PrpD family protein [Planctomycetales bacterium]|nr:MmgE/PrpD family protein [Planctomycetales bacterium]
MHPLEFLLGRDTNQARGLAEYARTFIFSEDDTVDPQVIRRLEQFHIDSVACGISALALGANAPRVLRDEALDYVTPVGGAYCFGSHQPVHPEKAVVANSSAVREWDSNGTNFGYNPARHATRGEFGHNDFYPVAVAGAQVGGHDGRRLLRAMLCLDEIRGRLAEVFGLKDYKIDHVLHGAIASAAVYGALTGATVDQIESAIGLIVAHYVPFRAIRAGHQLSDSKGASAAISAEAAVLCVHRAKRGFVGPADIFRNPQAVFCLFEPPAEPHTSPFDLALSSSGSDFAIMGMHFKLGLYEHQSAGAIQAVIDLLAKHPQFAETPDNWHRLQILIYQPAYGIIGDPAKRDPRTRQSADHSMVYIIATLLRKCYELQRTSWEDLMLVPADYDDAALFHPLTRELMSRIEFRHGGPEFDRDYPDGIPTQVDVELNNGTRCSSGRVMYPTGHARCTNGRLDELLQRKFDLLLTNAVDEPAKVTEQLYGLSERSAEEVRQLYHFSIRGLDK